MDVQRGLTEAAQARVGCPDNPQVQVGCLIVRPPGSSESDSESPGSPLPEAILAARFLGLPPTRTPCSLGGRRGGRGLKLRLGRIEV